MVPNLGMPFLREPWCPTVENVSRGLEGQRKCKRVLVSHKNPNSDQDDAFTQREGSGSGEGRSFFIVRPVLAAAENIKKFRRGRRHDGDTKLENRDWILEMVVVTSDGESSMRGV
jgi:hypothetical protein